MNVVTSQHVYTIGLLSLFQSLKADAFHQTKEG